MLTPCDIPRRPAGRVRPAALAALLAAALVWLVQALVLNPLPNAAFLATPGLRASALPWGSSARSLRRVALFAEGGEVVDAEMVDDEEGGEEPPAETDEEDEEQVAPQELEGLKYPAEAYMEYGPQEEPPQAWFDRRKIDTHKVNMKFFNEIAKPREFFPIDLRPGDTIRISFLDPAPGEKAVQGKMREVHFDGVIMNFKGKYHTRTITLRAMVGKGLETTGMELNIPMHSPLVTGIEVLRRGFIGRNKNAYFMRALIGKKNQIPEDKERTRLDQLYEDMRQERRYDEIPEPQYPLEEQDRYPWPVWKQDMPDWDESQYDPDLVDQRSQYEREVIGKFKKRIAPRVRRG